MKVIFVICASQKWFQISPLVGIWAEGIFVIPLAVGIYGIHEEIWICEIQLEICQISQVKVSWISEDWEIGWV